MSINYRVLIPLVVLFLVLTLIFPRTAKFSYDYRKGSPWSHETLLAQFDFPILKTDEQIREEKEQKQVGGHSLLQVSSGHSGQLPEGR